MKLVYAAESQILTLTDISKRAFDSDTEVGAPEALPTTIPQIGTRR